MAECDWAILCDYAFQDAGRKTCLIGIFDRIFTPQVPAAHHQASLAVRVVGDAGEEVDLLVEIVRPTGGSLARMEGKGSLPDSGSAEFQLQVAGLPIPDFGPYAFNVHVNGVLSRTTTFLVLQAPREPAKVQ